METLKDIIENQKVNYAGLEEYLSLIKLAEDNVEFKPDISIETSKAIIEGICKFILIRVDGKYEANKDFTDTTLSSLVKETAQAMREQDEEIILDESLIQRASSQVHLIGEYRNQRAEVSHGRSYPKELQIVSDPHTAAYILGIAEHTSSYLLNKFFSLNLGYKAKIEYSDPNHQEFNDYLDDINPLNDGFLYSRALYELDYTAYEDQLEMYLQDNE